MINNEKKIIFCGLPDSGKTTFLGALSYLTESNIAANSLKLEDLRDQRHFFNQLADTWVSCKPMLRTKVDSKDTIEMTLSDSYGKFDIELPDLSGETWAAMWSEHEISCSIGAFIEKCNSVAFFIHADQITVPMSISEENSMLQNQKEEDVTESALEHWDSSKHASTQAISVDLLTKLASIMVSSNKRVAIILSAWDKVDSSIAPMDFVEAQLPLLLQYLNSEFDYSHFKVFGVSAQGGCLDDSSQKESLINIDEPNERIKVSEDGVTNHSDLTQILSWLVND